MFRLISPVGNKADALHRRITFTACLLSRARHVCSSAARECLRCLPDPTSVLLQIPVDASEQEIHRLIDAGFPATTLKTLSELGQICPAECDQILSPKTLATLLARGQRLTVGESDQLFRLVHIISMVEVLFGNEKRPGVGSAKSKPSSPAKPQWPCSLPPRVLAGWGKC